MIGVTKATRKKNNKTFGDEVSVTLEERIQEASALWKCPQCGRTFKNKEQGHYCTDKPMNIDEYIRRQGSEKQMELELDNPLCLHFNPRLDLNGHELRASHGCAVTYNPCLPDGMGIELEAKWAVEHYSLDTSYGWVICRDAFPWVSKRRPEIRTLSLIMEQQLVSVPGLHFTVKAPGDSFHFVHPANGTEYTLTVQELEQQTLQTNSFGSGRWIYPTHFVEMRYMLSPEASERITVSDCDDSDKPLEIMPDHDSFAPSASSNAACIGIIGGADGPTAVVFGASSQGKLCTACSALHFEPVQHDIEWRITFHEKRFADFICTLI